MNFLVVQLARFGDIVQSKRLVKTLARRGEVTLAVDASLASLARLLYPQCRIAELRIHGASPKQVLEDNLAVFRELKESSPSKVHFLNFSGLSFALASLFDPEIVVGYRWDNGQPVRDAWQGQALRWSRRRGMSPLNLVDYWAYWDMNPISPRDVNPEARPKGKGLGVVLAGRHSRRSLPMESLALIAQALRDRLQTSRVVLLGSRQERPLAKAFLAAAGRSLLSCVADRVGRTSWEELFAEVAGLDMLLTPDTGTMHLAAHLGTPVMATFLSSAWCWETGPYGEGHQVLQAATPCLPCLETEPCRHDLACLKPFQSKELLNALAGRKSFEDLPLLLLNSRLDNLGVTYESSSGQGKQDSWATQRSDWRALIAEYLEVAAASKLQQLPLAEILFQERDWMTPASGRVHSIFNDNPAVERASCD